MAWAPDYILEADLRSYAGISGTANSAELGYAISAASRAIDDYTGRQFGQGTAAVSRVYTAQVGIGTRIIVIDDLMELSGLVVKANTEEGGSYSQTLSTYSLGPVNALADGKPYTSIRATDFPLWADGVQVTAQWGWDAVPSQVEQACLLQALRFFMRRGAPFGVAGSPGQGSELRLLNRLDPDVQLLLDPLRRLWVV